GRIDAPGRAPRLPERGIDHARIAGAEGDVDGAGVGVLEEDLLPALASVRRAEDAALRVGAVGMAEGRQEHAVGVAGIDDDSPDLLRVRETDVAPGAPAVRGLVGAVALRDVGAHVRLARADVEDARVGRGEGDGSDGPDGLAVEDRPPGAAGVGRLPDPAVDAAEVEVLALARHPRHREHAAAAERADEPPP